MQSRVLRALVSIRLLEGFKGWKCCGVEGLAVLGPEGSEPKGFYWG